MTDQYKELLGIVQNLNRSTIYALPEGRLVDLIKKADIEHNRIEHALPRVVYSFDDEPRTSIEFILSYEDGHKRKIVISYNEYGGVCKAFVGIA